MRFVFISIVIVFLFRSIGYPQGMDFSGMKVFWEIMECLEKDIMPSEDKWDELFNTPGYITGNEHEFSHDYFIKFYTLAYMPSKKNALKISGLVPQSGHPTGYYMANALLDHAGTESLVENFGNPFSFFRRYSDMACRSNGKYPPFSDEALQLIGELEERYAK